MKILQIINSLNAGGAEKLLVDTSVRYVKNGLNVDVLVLNGTKTQLFDSLSENKEINIISLGDEKNTYKPMNIFKIKKIISRYDLIHVHLFPALYWSVLAKMVSKSPVPIVFTEHNTTNRRRQKKIFQILDKIIYKKLTRIVTISDAVDQNLHAHLGANNMPVTKIYNGIDLEKIRCSTPYTKEELGYKVSDKLIIQVASFYKQKDQKTVIRALQLLPENCKLLLAGSGPLEKELVALVNDLQLDSRVSFLGVRSDVPRLLKTVDLVVLSSHFEGLSLSSIEGMASGKPFIASEVPGLAEVVQGAGVLFENRNFRELADVIQKLLKDTKYAKSISEACIERAAQFDVNNMVINYINLYKSVV